ncbi:MAG: Heme/hemopexin transporter protein HuxB [Candidatus Anoxychlamydiales bacterium]|nr:Heme/hemopexin transporter protein HuxB [Candidatus Anoxychlamydiales bacterium]
MKILFIISSFLLLQGFCEDKNQINDFKNFSKGSQIVDKPIYIEPMSKKELLADKVKALIFTNQPMLIDEECLQDYEGIELEGFRVNNFEKFQNEFAIFLNKPLTLEVLERIKDTTLTYFKKNTPYLVDIKILENQDVSTGRVQILVMFARLGEMTSSGAKYFSNSRLLKKLNVEHNECINIHRIQKYLSSFNQNPFRNTSLILEPGEEIGYTDIHLQTQDLFPVRVYGGYENTGNEIASKHRFLTGLNFGNFLYLDHQMNIEFRFAPHVSKWWGISGNYIIPTYFNTYFKIIGSYVRTKPDTDPDYELRGKAWTALARYHVPIYLFEDGTSELIFGYDFKQTNNFLNFIATSVFNELIDISQFVFQFTGNNNDRFGLTSYLLSLYYSPGDMTDHNENKNFQAEGYAQKSKYFYATLHFDRTFRIPKEFLYVMEFFGQLSSVKLLPTEEISIGGFYTVRGYQENAVFGDDGFYFRNEIRSPNMKHAKYKNLHDWQFLAFVDTGYVRDLNDNVSNKNSSFLASLGPGLRYTVENYFILKLDYGVQLKKANRDFFAKSWHSKLHVFVSLQY